MEKRLSLSAETQDEQANKPTEIDKILRHKVEYEEEKEEKSIQNSKLIKTNQKGNITKNIHSIANSNT
jgi:hypothetical protein